MIDYSVYMMPNPSKPDVAPKAYARAQVKEVVSLDKFVKHLSEHLFVFDRLCLFLCRFSIVIPPFISFSK